MDVSTQLSPNFTVADLIVTSTGIPNVPDDSYLPNLTALANVLELLRQIDTFTVVSGFRSPAVNASVGGADYSYHSDGLAADILPDNISNQDFWQHIHNTPRFSNALGEYIYYPLSHRTIHVSTPTAAKVNFDLMQNAAGTYVRSNIAPEPSYNMDLYSSPGAD